MARHERHNCAPTSHIAANQAHELGKIGQIFPQTTQISITRGN